MLTALKLDKLQHWLQALRAAYPALIKSSSAQAIVVPRAKCLYRCFDLRDIPASSQRQALQLKIQQWSPWPNPLTNIIWQNNFAQVWCWQAETEIHPKINYLVETRFSPRINHSGHQLLACNPGYEAQYWQQGILKESHWWPETPTPAIWKNFQRAAGIQDYADLPAITTEKLPQAWGKNYKLDKNALLIALEQNIWQAVPITVIFLIAWQGLQIYRLHQDIRSQRQQQTELSQQIETILQTRNHIQQDQHYLNQITSLWRGYRQLQLLSDVVTHLPDPSGMKIMHWEYSPTQLRFMLQTSNTDPSVFVKNYTDLPWAKEVTAQPDPKNGHITLIIRLKHHDSL